MARSTKTAAKHGLPATMKELFWEYNFRDLSWEEDRDLVISRVLTAGDWGSIQWLRKQVGDASLRRWIERREGRALSPPQLRYWQTVLGINHRRVSSWIESETRRIWDKRKHA